MRELLLVEDHSESRRSLGYLLEQNGYRVHQAANGRAAVAAARREGELHGMVLDLKLPDMDGLSVLDAVQAAHPGLPTIIVTGFGTIDTAVDAMKRGATDFLTKPIEVDNLLVTLERAISAAAQTHQIPSVRSHAILEMEELGIIGYSRVMFELYELIERVAPHLSTVLVVGESGSGKELVARALHTKSPRSSGPFVAINCASLSEQMLESELFGHERGAFTGADRMKIGVMEVADSGTMFLDEVSEMGLGSQAKLLRALERREFRRVGGTKKIKVDVNLIAASNVDLEARVADAKFRPDLYYRLKVLSIAVPPLRERRDAIEILARRFLEDVAHRTGTAVKALAPQALALLERYPWPGNVRELKNCMESLTLLTSGSTIHAEDLPGGIRESPLPEMRFRVGSKLSEVEQEMIRATLAASPTVKDAAVTLGVPLRTFHAKLKKYGLRKGR